MAQTVIRARESTANILSTQVERYVDREIARLTPDAAPLTVLTKRATKTSIDSPKPEWFEKGLPARWDQVNNGAGYTTGDTAIVVDNSEYFSINDTIVFVRTGEHARVTAVTTGTDTLTVARGVGSTAAASLVDNDDVLILGPSFAEGAALGLEKSHQPTAAYNYTEILRTPFGETETERLSRKYVGGEKELMAEKLVEHMIDIERKMWFGERNINTTDTAKPIRYMGGALYYLTSNITSSVGTLTEPELETSLQSIFNYTGASDSRTMFASPLVITALDQLAAGRIQTVSDKNATYGIAVKQWVTGHGTLNIVKNRLFENGAGGQGYGGYAAIVDTSKLKYFYLGDRDTKLRKNVGDPGDDGYTHEYLTECCVAWRNPEFAGWLTGVTG